MKNACLLIRDKPLYRRDAFAAGLEACGWKVSNSPKPEKGGLLVIWNRYGANDDLASRYESAGGHVIVAENGYFGRDNPGGPYYALNLNQHHHGGAPIRNFQMTVMQPWRESGDHILVAAQRGIGSRMMASPSNWAEKTAADLQQKTKRLIKIRRHPGNDQPKIPLADDLRNAHAIVVWSSNAGVQALSMGIPAFYAAPRWIAEKAAIALSGADLERPFMGDRSDGLCAALSNAWSVDDIARGIPFAALLSPTWQGQGA